jgi:hypothetical protein
MKYNVGDEYIYNDRSEIIYFRIKEKPDTNRFRVIIPVETIVLDKMLLYGVYNENYEASPDVGRFTQVWKISDDYQRELIFQLFRMTKLEVVDAKP